MLSILSGLPCSLALAVCTLALAIAPVAAVTQSADATTTGASRAFNPALSLNALILGQYLDGEEHEEEDHEGDEHEHGALEEGFSVQELELRFTADVDAYARADATIAAHADEIELEEAYADLLALPAGLGLRAGKFYAPFSRESARHTHQLPFVQRSLGLSSIFPEGFAAPGVMLSWLPAIGVYTELRAAAVDGSHTAFFGSEDGGGLVGLGQIHSLFDLGETTTIGLQAAAGGGENSAGRTSQLATAGLDLRWKPARRTIYRGLRAGAEFTWADRPGDFESMDDELDGLPGMSAWTAVAQVQFARRWWISARHDWLDPKGGVDATRWGASFSFVASEFQALRLEFSSTDDGDERSNSVFLQYNITIGSHPAHLY